jgi:hypothetical protein
MNLKAVAAIAALLVVAVFAGWFWGASGKAAVTAERRAFEERAEFAEARADLLDARSSLAASNFGDAAKFLEHARGLVVDLQSRFRETGQAERAGRVEIVLAEVRDAQRLTMALDRTAGDAAARAGLALAGVQK